MLTKEDDAGFTLVEMAVVLAIVGLLLGGLLPTISGQIEMQRRNETRKTLEEIKDALFGFAIANGRLPCPAISTSSGQESFSGAVGASACTGSANSVVHGFVPAATLGLAPTDSEGFLLDDWNNRMRYAVYTGATYSGATNNCNTTNPSGLPDAFTTTDRMKAVTMACLSSTATMLSVCSTEAGSSPSACAAGAALVSQTPAVIYSTGNNGGYGGTGADENQNPNPNSTITPDRVFVSHTPTPSPNEFDDLVIWLSPNTLYNRMVAAGKLP